MHFVDMTDRLESDPSAISDLAMFCTVKDLLRRVEFLSQVLEGANRQNTDNTPAFPVNQNCVWAA